MRSEPANQWNAEDAGFPDVCERKGRAITATDAPTPVDVDTLKRTGVELGRIPEVYQEGLTDQQQVD